MADNMVKDTIKKIATRESYGNALKELAEEFPDLVVLDADLAAATKTGIFKKAYPERHIDCGIAECNMMGVAAGLSLVGKIPFVSSFAMFAAGRAYEQVRNSVGYPHLNVKIGATHAGITVGEDGATHQCNEDLALMRTIPGMVVMCPSDDIEAKAAVRAALEHEGKISESGSRGCSYNTCVYDCRTGPADRGQTVKRFFGRCGEECHKLADRRKWRLCGIP